MGKDESSSTPLPKITLTLTVRKEFTDVEAFIKEFGPNIYQEGMFIPSSRPKPAGWRVQLDFRTNDGKEILQGEAEVLRADEEMPGVMPGMWVGFRTLSPEHRAFVQQVYGRREVTFARMKPVEVLGGAPSDDEGNGEGG